MERVKKGIYQSFLKRTLDTILALVSLLLLAPLFLLLALLIRMKLGTPILFRQERPGLYGRIFTIYKFRTMSEVRDANGTLLSDQERLTRFGRLLRATSLDELPELLNILKGEMSFIGPRPLLPQYLPLYSERQRLRMEVRPGLSGLAQVNGRNAISWEEKFEYDLAYVKQITFWVDLKILLLTLRNAWKREGIHSGTSETMEIFPGNHGEGKGTLELRKRLILIGAGGHGRSAADVARKMNRWETIAFLDDRKETDSVMGVRILGKTEDYLNYLSDSDLFVTIGDNRIRQKLQKQLEESGASIPVLLHPGAILGDPVTLGPGTVVMAGAVINCLSEIGKGCIINTGATVDHENVLGDYVHLSPGTHLAGRVKIGDRTWLGIGSTVINDISIACDTRVGAGSLVLRDIPEPGTYVGVPIRKIEKNREGEKSTV